MECIYHYTVIDRDLSTRREYDQILQIGDSICKYGDYGNYRLDSAMATMPVVTNRDLMCYIVDIIQSQISYCYI